MPRNSERSDASLYIACRRSARRSMAPAMWASRIKTWAILATSSAITSSRKFRYHAHPITLGSIHSPLLDSEYFEEKFEELKTEVAKLFEHIVKKMKSKPTLAQLAEACDEGQRTLSHLLTKLYDDKSDMVLRFDEEYRVAIANDAKADARRKTVKMALGLKKNELKPGKNKIEQLHVSIVKKDLEKEDKWNHYFDTGYCETDRLDWVLWQLFRHHSIDPRLNPRIYRQSSKSKMEALPYHQVIGPRNGPLFVLLDREKTIAVGDHLYGNIFSCPKIQSPIGFILKRPSGHLVAVNHSDLAFNAQWDDGVKKDRLSLNRVDHVFEVIALREDSKWMITFELEKPDAIAEVLGEDPRFAKAPAPDRTAKLLEPPMTSIQAEVDRHVERQPVPTCPSAPPTHSPPSGGSGSYTDSGRRPAGTSPVHTDLPAAPRPPQSTFKPPPTPSTENNDNVGIHDTPQVHGSNSTVTISTISGNPSATHKSTSQASTSVPVNKGSKPDADSANARVADTIQERYIPANPANPPNQAYHGHRQNASQASANGNRKQASTQSLVGGTSSSRSVMPPNPPQRTNDLPSNGNKPKREGWFRRTVINPVKQAFGLKDHDVMVQSVSKF
ncbi:hypothetical protein AB1N83_003663 [Pleurotus pulmonarius]